MAARPGEDLAATLFADIHYYYGPPTAKPPHHRFDKGSYVYLFENSSQRRARLEVANNAGTPNQDAFNGFLDGTHVHYSYRHPSLLTVTVDGLNGQRHTSIPAEAQEWHLPTFDPRNENKYMYRLHTIDIYFWTKEDAQKFLGGVRRVLPEQQLTLQDEPIELPAHTDIISPVVQKLESVAITDPPYQLGHSRDSRASISTQSSVAQSTQSSHPSMQNNSLPGLAPTVQAPLAYNPAAPAAPEAIKHREKTPPPEDGAVNPLVAAATSDQGQTYGAPYQYPGGGFSGPPSSQQYPGYFSGPQGQTPASPPPPQPQQVHSPFAQHFQHSFAPPPTSATNPPPGPPAYQAQSPQQPTQLPSYSGPSGFSSPGMGVRSSSFPSVPTSGDYNPNAAAPPGGFAQYNYNPSLSGTQPIMTDYSIHQQVYRPTEHESASKHKPAKPPTRRLEARAGQVETKVNGLLKKLEKKVG